MKKRSLATARIVPQGFTLVEVMVAMVIGMIGLIVMMQVFSVAEGQRRTTTGSGDAQSNGAIALYALQRDIRQGGYGFNALNAMGCPLTLPAPASRTLTQLAPVVINADVPAGDANSDTLLVTFGNNEGPPEGDVVTAVNGELIAVSTAINYSANQWVVAAPAAPLNGCALAMAQVTAVAAPNIAIAASGAVDGGTLFNLGGNPRILAYAVRAGNLTVCNYLLADCGADCTAGDGTCSASWVPIANDIVSLRAEYGHASTATSGVDSWNQTTPADANQAALACLWARTSALRIAVVARNSQVDRGQLTAAAPTWAGSGDDAAPNIDLSARANWQNYRYKVFETVIPLRNLPWMSACT
ncbi:PilW family protein [Candidatus Accumulibacter sp. ACC003]|uniref:PilW family protein n=1 Tax=Candidatus Accumulibacter sp. ACC003 TaxID=2823334 RepID=UPI0025C3F627|nr:PilW family protein [Candidatus Accumulibacter sp. ACC003]